jgi:hypothetical protein
MLKRWSTVGTVLALVVLSAVPAAAGPDGTNRPFKATLTGEVYWEFPGESPSDCTPVTTNVDATGNATHMGRVVAHWSHCPAEPGYVLDGRITVVAANGDELHGIYDYDPPGGGVVLSIYFEGGTGRFAEASGVVTATSGLVPVLKEGCDDPTNIDCLDFSQRWQWWSTLIGSIDL